MSVLMNFSSTQHTSARSKKATIENELEEAAVPDSTTTIEKERPDFSNGQDVLVNHKDGRYYLGTVVEVDVIREQCLVKFGDNTESWSSFKDLTKLSQLEEELLCVVCKKSAPKDKHEIVICDKCSRGYHQRCHQPEIPSEALKDGASWMCWRCMDHLSMRSSTNNTANISSRSNSIGDIYNSSSNNKQQQYSQRKRTASSEVSAVLPTDRSKLPYNPDVLTWDTYHRVNSEQIYCYCGKTGEWYSQMLQCGRCRQWFHEKCIGCLQFPLYCGDRFYVFVCSICNYGKEFVRRLELKWVDLVHLMLFNLTAFNVKKYYDLDTIIIPYVNDNWHALQLPPKILNVSKSERRENILSILTNNRNRFKCGREIKKRTTIWGLRLRLPPPAPCVTLPTVGPITEDLLRERWQGNRRLQFLRHQENGHQPNAHFGLGICATRAAKYNGQNAAKTDDCMIVPVDPTMMNIMRGMAYQESNLSETESPSPSPTTGISGGDSATTNGLGAADSNQLKLYKMDFEGGGFVKKSVPFPNISLQRRKRLLALRDVRDRDKMLRKKRKTTAGKTKSGATNAPANQMNTRTKRFSLDSATEINGAHGGKRNTHIDLPLTPPTSVSAPPTPPASNTPTQQGGSGRADFSTELAQNLNVLSANMGKTKLTRSALCATGLDSNLHTPCDTSGDETSSKSTLDLIIPPPKDFEGKNNPFHALLAGRTGGTTSLDSKSKAKKKRHNAKEAAPPARPASSASQHMAAATTAAAATNNNTSLTLTAVQAPAAQVPSLPLPLTAVIPGRPIARPLKRQLSEKDICIGPNGEVKRRRLRRGRHNSIGGPIPPASKTATVVPARADMKEWNIGHRNLRSAQAQIGNCVDYALNGRRLRQRQTQSAGPQDLASLTAGGGGGGVSTVGGGCKESKSAPGTPKLSPVKQEPDINMDDLKTSVNQYFGAANRIANGEPFTIRAKRVGPLGKTQYLIEWEAPPLHGMT